MLTPFVLAVLWFFAIFALVFGAVTIIMPEPIGRLLGHIPDGSSGHNEVRSQYGGFFFAAGLLLLSAVLGKTPAVWSFVFLTVLFGGLTLGRLLSLLADWGKGRYLPAIAGLMLFDPVAFAVSAVALWMVQPG